MSTVNEQNIGHSCEKTVDKPCAEHDRHLIRSTPRPNRTGFWNMEMQNRSPHRLEQLEIACDCGLEPGWIRNYNGHAWKRGG